MTTTPQAALLSAQEIEEMALQEQFLLVCDGLDELTCIVRAVESAILAKLQATQAEPVQEGELPPLPSSAHWEERIKTLMQQTPLPNSMSVYQAFKQFQNEFEHATVEYARAALSARKPLTDEQRGKAYREVRDRLKLQMDYQSFSLGCDCTERAHGIGLEVKP